MESVGTRATYLIRFVESLAIRTVDHVDLRSDESDERKTKNANSALPERPYSRNSCASRDGFSAGHLQKDRGESSSPIDGLPMSQTLSLKPLDCTLFILKPCVGVMWEMSSEARTLSSVVCKVDDVRVQLAEESLLCRRCQGPTEGCVVHLVVSSGACAVNSAIPDKRGKRE